MWAAASNRTVSHPLWFLSGDHSGAGRGVLVRYYFERRTRAAAHRLSCRRAGAPEYYLVGYTPPSIVINEFLALNNSVNQDEAGEYEDWLELHNTGTQTQNAGLYLTDDSGIFVNGLSRRTFSLPPGGYLLIWCDEDRNRARSRVLQTRRRWLRRLCWWPTMHTPMCRSTGLSSAHRRRIYRMDASRMARQRGQPLRRQRPEEQRKLSK